jgi:hypothetical protein
VSQPPKKKHTGCIVLAVIVGLIVICVMIGQAINPQGNTTSTTTTSDTSSTQTSMQPTPTPLTNKDAIAKQVQVDITNAQLQGDDIQAGYGAKGNAFVIIGLKPPLMMSQGDQLALVQNDCFDGQKAIWQDPLLQKVAWTDVYIFTQDSQGLPVTVGECILHPANAHKIDWNNTDAFTAWNNKVYENMTPSN